MGFQVPLMSTTPNMEDKFQLLSVNKPSKDDIRLFKSDLDYLMHKSWDLCCKSGLHCFV